MKNLNIPPLLQDDYGLENDCTLTSLTSLVCYYKGRSDYGNVYETVETIAKAYGYGVHGTNPLAIKPVLQRLANLYAIFGVPKMMLFKSNRVLNEIRKQLDSGNPVVMNVHKAGKYKNHSVLIVGYIEDRLVINDNWTKTPQTVAWSEVSRIMSINYLEE